MRVLFTSTWGYGHVFPMVPLARAFAAAGHDVLWATNEPTCPTVAAAGIDVAAAGLDTAGVTDTKRRLAEGTNALRPQDRAGWAFPTMFGEWATPPMARDLLPLARDWRPDLLVHENAELAAPLVAAVLGLPCVTHAFGGAVPAPFVATAAERVGPLWAEHGVRVPPYAGAFASGYLDICPPPVQTQSLDHIPVRQALRPLAYTGESTGPLPPFVTDEDPRPLVYLTLGTVHNKAPVLAAAVRGLAELPIRLLVAVGADGDPAALGPQPDHVQVERWVCQSEVLAHCSVVVSHGGSGTVLGALAHGLPQLCLPQAADQFRNSEAAVASGAGLALHPDAANAAAITDAVRRLLGSDRFRAAAVQLAAEIASMPGPDDVVPVLEELA
jgi:UDP:flavonoid glycosyltransferase YjiC (YdhE family)